MENTANEEPEVLSFTKKFLLILWKNLCMLFGRKGQLALLIIFAFVIPLVFAFLIWQAENEYSIKHEHEQQTLIQNGQVFVLYSPQNKILESLINGVSFPEYDGSITMFVGGYVDAKTLEAVLRRDAPSEGVCGIEFPDEWSDISELPHRFRFALRFPITKEKHFKTNRLISLHNDKHEYQESGFLLIQREISIQYLQKKNSTQAVIRPKLEQLYTNVELIYGDFLPLILLCVFAVPFVLDVKDIVEEKELQLKEMLSIFDVSNSLQWLAWYVKSMIITIIISLFVASIWTLIDIRRIWPFQGMPLLAHTGWSVFLFFMLVCSHSFICFGFLVSSFCSRSIWVGIIAPLLLIASSVPTIIADKDTTGTLASIVCSIFVCSAMGMGLDRIVIWEEAGLGLQWSNLFKTSWLNDSISVGAILLIMLLVSLISILICLYIEQVRPGEFGTPQPWSFPCTKRFWCPAKYMRRVLSLPVWYPVQRGNSKLVNANAKGQISGVQIKSLSKSFGKRQVVTRLTFDLFENEIMVLLGHNGAGKTTTIQMLTGTIQPSSGTAIINGYDIQTERLLARRSLSICPQKSIFFGGLSAASHLRFYSRLRGLKGAAVKQEVDKYLQKLSLQEKANSSARSLSGGTQRRLALACALCGNVKVVFCDEPSSGLDPSSRLELWKLLLDEKQGRTILLTTHQMDEGEVLADRIAIISDGRLRCLGTLASLKKQYETSHLLTCEKGPRCDVPRLTQLIAEHVPHTRLQSNIGSDVSYRLPHRFLRSFGSLFNDLEQQKEQLDVVGFGLSSASLAEIFMSHGAEDLGSGGGGRTSGGGLDEQRQRQAQRRRDNCCLCCLGQWEAMLLKKILYIYDKKWMLLVILLLPLVIYLLTIIRGQSSSYMKRLPLTLADYKSDDVLILLQPKSDARPMRDISNAYQELAQQHCTVERISQNVGDYIGPGQETPERMYEIKRSLIAAVTVDQEMIVWSRNDPFLHSAPLSLNLAFNAMAKAVVGHEASIEVTNAPYQWGEYGESDTQLTIPLTISVSIYLSIVLAIFAILVVQEKVTQIRMQQQMSGVNMVTYWLTHYIPDLVLYFVFSLALLVAVHESCHPGDMLLILMIIGVASLPFTYIIACLFRNAGTAVVIISTIHILIGGLFAILMVMVYHRVDETEFRWIIYVFYPYPVFTGTFAVANGFERFMRCHADFIPVENLDELRLNCTPGLTPINYYCNCFDILDWVEVKYLLISGIIYLLMLFFANYITTVWYGLKYILFWLCLKKKPASDDEDVAAAAERISKMSTEDRKKHALVLKRVSKRFCCVSAVRGISFTVKPGECFGLLGANGAGKTTTFKMIVGEISSTMGSIHVRGYSLKWSPTAARKQIGYCPQHDTLFDFCTGRQTLRIFLLLRGTPRNLVTEASEKLASDYGFFKHLDNKVKDYSGGTKRKLNAAVAGEGSSLICLDEPSSGVDPASRRHVWNVLSSLRDSGKAVLLSSHSMEEVEALCTQLAIMVDGKIHCLGSQQRIKNKLAQVLVLKLVVETSPESMAHTLKTIKNQMNLDYPNSWLEEEFGGRLTYHIPTDKLRWSRVFLYIEKNQSSWKVADYSLAQPSLEDVFLDIVKKKSKKKNQSRQAE
ncbi:retinal-specific phospholipid-transporting ATPase ABCA4-like isoform X1 [Drosophila miranda]|uniref:retinal-specific phospholipid-transporting ATPase ABCA4-like isoform X1 n=1 Tax=Drosophila miranda TaxID=7229 RepID=UPI00143F476D|nr:retinal-specific phospholipid-transporting ATPase ABCA4-like isoform X1 [Drosophila miranda]